MLPREPFPKLRDRGRWQPLKPAPFGVMGGGGEGNPWHTQKMHLTSQLTLELPTSPSDHASRPAPLPEEEWVPATD